MCEDSGYTMKAHNVQAKVCVGGGWEEKVCVHIISKNGSILYSIAHEELCLDPTVRINYGENADTCWYRKKRWSH